MLGIKNIVLIFVFVLYAGKVLCSVLMAGHHVPEKEKGKEVFQRVFANNYKNERKSDVLDRIYDVVDEDARFPGGVVALLQYINSSLRYPVKAYEQGIQGRVLCSFVIEKDGRITDVRILRGVDASLDNEAMRVISGMPHWNPGILRGEVVRSRYIMPVIFRR